MKKVILILASLGFTISLMGFLLMQDLDIESPGLYFGLIIIGIISIISFTILIINYKSEGIALFSRYIGIFYLILIVLLIVFTIAFKIWKHKTGYKTKRDVMIEFYYKLNEQYQENNYQDSTKMNDTIK